MFEIESLRNFLNSNLGFILLTHYPRLSPFRDAIQKILYQKILLLHVIKIIVIYVCLCNSLGRPREVQSAEINEIYETRLSLG